MYAWVYIREMDNARLRSFNIDLFAAHSLEIFVKKNRSTEFTTNMQCKVSKIFYEQRIEVSEQWRIEGRGWDKKLNNFYFDPYFTKNETYFAEL